MTPKAYLFDMDLTLIGCDSDVSWKNFAVEEHLAGAEVVERSARYYADYERGELDYDEFLRYQVEELVGLTLPEAEALCSRHFEKMVKPFVYEKARVYLKSLRGQGVPVGILTATNVRIAAPIAAYFKVDFLIGTELEMKDGRYTGERSGVYAGGEGKVVKARAYCEKSGFKMSELSYCGDSINDRFLLDAVGFPCAANPEGAMLELAKQRQWPTIDFRP